LPAYAWLVPLPLYARLQLPPFTCSCSVKLAAWFTVVQLTV
jgi:hypothetical protein